MVISPDNRTSLPSSSSSPLPSSNRIVTAYPRTTAPDRAPTTHYTGPVSTAMAKSACSISSVTVDRRYHPGRLRINRQISRPVDLGHKLVGQARQMAARADLLSTFNGELFRRCQVNESAGRMHGGIRCCGINPRHSLCCLPSILFGQNICVSDPGKAWPRYADRYIF